MPPLILKKARFEMGGHQGRQIVADRLAQLTGRSGREILTRYRSQRFNVESIDFSSREMS